MANEMQRGNLTGTAIMRMQISGTVSIGGKQMKELRFMPYSEFPEEGREDVLYIDTDGNAMYYWNGTEYIALSGGGSGGTSNYNELSNKPSINDITLTGNKTSADLGLQPTISDIATIRSGAASGATAVQPSDMETALSGKQDTISDLQTIRSGAALGATAVQPADMETALANKQDVISDLDAIRSGATAGSTALQSSDVDTLPTDGSSNPVSSGGTYNFVNSSIATNTAYFIGTFASVAELEAYSGTVTNNDYAFVTSTDSAGNTLYNRYKYNAATQTWSFEYAVNNTAFTTAQWAAIQSGMTSADKTKLDGIETGATKTVIDSSPTSASGNAVSSGGVYTALAGKQDTISDLSTIRSGASAGATAVQTIQIDGTAQTKTNGVVNLPAYPTTLPASDVTSTYSASGTAPVNGTAVNAAIGTLNATEVGGSGKYISAISETNGKIAATPTTFDTALSSSSTDNNTPTSKTVYDDQQRQEVEIGAVANRGAKNFAVPFDPISATDISVTKNADGSFTFACTNVSENRIIRIANIGDMPSGTYKFSGVTGGSSSTYMLGLYNTSSTAVKYQHTNLEESYTGNVSGFSLRVRVISGYSGTFTVYPMIRPASITDSTFVPYAKTNRELTVAEDEDRAALIAQVDGGAKNLIKLGFSLKTVGTVTGSMTSDGNGITVNGDRTQTTDVILVYDIITDKSNSIDTRYTLPAGQYVLNAALSAVKVQIYCHDGTSESFERLAQTGTSAEEFVYTAEKKIEKPYICVRLWISRSHNYNNETVYPMICTAADWAVSQKYVPYAPTNRELYEMIKALQTE